MINDFTKGGQTFFQKSRLFSNIFGKLFFVFVLLFILFFVGIFYIKTTAFERYKAFTLLKIEPMCLISSDVYTEMRSVGFLNSSKITGNKSEFTTFSGQKLYLTDKQLIDRIATPKFMGFMRHVVIWSAIQSFILTMIALLLIIQFLAHYGKKLSTKKILRGARFTELEDFVSTVKEKNGKKLSDISIAGVPIPEKLETQHIWINGVSGAGKTVAFCDLMFQMRAQGKRAVVYDYMGVYVERLYRPGKDVILNPFDKRSPCWSPWAECKHSVDYEMIAASQISITPGTTEDPFWKKAARSLYSATLRRLANEGKGRNMTLLRYLLTADLDKLRALLKNTEAEALVAKDIEKTALSVKAILNDDIKAMRFLEDSGQLFSIRDWVKEDEGDSWIFITSRADQHETLMPLISTWYDIAITEALSLPDNEKRRIYFPLDELPTLKYLPALKRGMPLGRQKGLCFILGTQGFSQMNVNYGHEEAKSIIGNAATKIILRSGLDAEKISHVFNQSEVQERSESISYGVTDNRDGVSITDRKNTQFILLPSQLKTLDDLNAYFSIPGDYPITQIKYKYIKYPSLNERFVAKDSDVDWLFDSSDQSTPEDSISFPQKDLRFQKKKQQGRKFKSENNAIKEKQKNQSESMEIQLSDSDIASEKQDDGAYKF